MIYCTKFCDILFLLNKIIISVSGARLAASSNCPVVHLSDFQFCSFMYILYGCWTLCITAITGLPHVSQVREVRENGMVWKSQGICQGEYSAAALNAYFLHLKAWRHFSYKVALQQNFVREIDFEFREIGNLWQPWIIKGTELDFPSLNFWRNVQLWTCSHGWAWLSNGSKPWPMVRSGMAPYYGDSEWNNYQIFYRLLLIFANASWLIVAAFMAMFVFPLSLL